MRVDLFDFTLPDEAIALRPASPRDHARLLHIQPSGCFTDQHVFDLAEIFKPGDVLVINETKVFPSALKAKRPARPIGGGGDVTLSLNLHKKVDDQSWRVFIKPAKRVRENDILDFGNGLTAIVTQKRDRGDILLQFNRSGSELMQSFDEIGQPPLPPYIGRQREVDERDREDYQTVYATEKGSVAAPTAGLHFTPDLIQSLRRRGVQFEKVLLHVGAGTFLPVTADDIANHIMHSEWYSIKAETADRINKAKNEGRRVIAVGTTSLRALESSTIEGRLKPQSKETDIFITPGYKFKLVDGMMTNFHLPRSTLFMLVCAFAGTEQMQTAYRHAIMSGYRFYSYGDSSLIWRKE